jgi:hypothetical protein
MIAELLSRVPGARDPADGLAIVLIVLCAVYVAVYFARELWRKPFTFVRSNTHVPFVWVTHRDRKWQVTASDSLGVESFSRRDLALSRAVFRANRRLVAIGDSVNDYYVTRTLD